MATEFRQRCGDVYVASAQASFGRHPGRQHRKSAILDNRVVHSGGANLTKSNLKNSELVVRFGASAVASETMRLMKPTMVGAEELQPVA